MARNMAGGPLKGVAFGWVIWEVVSGISSPAHAQNPPVFATIGIPATTAGGNKSGSVTTTNAFQLVFAAAAPQVSNGAAVRHGCIIENTGNGTLYVSEGKTAATATTTTSFQLTASTGTNPVFTCDRLWGVLQGEIDIGGTAANTFYAAQF